LTSDLVPAPSTAPTAASQRDHGLAVPTSADEEGECQVARFALHVGHDLD
jgi:hypothetical protein